MDIANQLKTLKQIKDDIKTALIEKGAEVSDSTPFKSYAEVIENLQISSDEPDTPVEPVIPVNALLLGNLKNENGVLSGFDAESFAILNGKIPNGYPNAEIVIGFTTGDDVTTKQALFDTCGENKYGGWGLYIEGTYLKLSRGKGGSSSWLTAALTNFVLEPNTKYYFKLEHPNSKYLISSISTDNGVTYTTIKNEYTSTTSDPYRAMQGMITLGCINSSEQIGAFLGTFDLHDNYIKVGDTIIWKGLGNLVYNSNIKLVGNAKTAGGYLWGFDANSYGVIDYQLPNDLTNHEFEIVLDFHIYTTSTKYGILDTNKDNYLTGMSLSVTKGWLVRGSGDGIDYSFGVSTSNSTFSANKHYRITITNKDYTEPNVIVENVTDNTTANYGTMPSLEALHGIIALGMAGTDQANDVAQSAVNFLDGYFNLNNCYIEIDGVKVWQGVLK